MEGDGRAREDPGGRPTRLTFRALLLAATGILGLAAAPVLARLVRSWPWRAAVVDRSMEPTLVPGDWILIDPDVSSMRSGDTVVADDPHHPGESIVKRLGGRRAGGVELTSDGIDQRYVVPESAIAGRAWFRYWPAGRVGRIR